MCSLKEQGGAAMPEKRFMELVEKYQGFEFYQAYRDEVDHILGGKGDTYWYSIMKDGKVKESYIASCKDGVWNDRHVKGSGKRKSEKELPPGSVIKRIAEKAYLMQEEKWVKDKKARVIEDAHPHFHYTYGFGDKGLDVSAEYGVTIAYSDIKLPEDGFHLRYLYTGSDVEMP